MTAAPYSETELSEQRWLPCLNVDSVTIPAHAVVQVEREEPLENLAGVETYRIKRVAETGGEIVASSVVQGAFITGDDIGFTGHVPLEPNQAGIFTLDTPAVARSDTPSATGTPKLLMPVATQFTLNVAIGATQVPHIGTFGLCLFAWLGWHPAAPLAIVQRVRHASHWGSNDDADELPT